MFRPLARRIKRIVYGAIPASRLVERGPSAGRKVALTFDDGPDDKTPAYLDAMDKLGVPGTFFLVGQYSERYPDLVREYVKRGHQIAGHGYDHARFTSLGPWELKGQIDKTTAALGPQPTKKVWVRPPYGAVNGRVLGQLLLQDTRIALWSLDSHDYEIHDPEEVARRCSPANVRAGEVILLHEGQQWTIDALPRIVGDLRSSGYQMVTMADLVGE